MGWRVGQCHYRVTEYMHKPASYKVKSDDFKVHSYFQIFSICFVGILQRCGIARICFRPLPFFNLGIYQI